MVDTSGGMKAHFDKLLKRAQEQYAAGQADQAAATYEQCARLMKQMVADAVSPSVQRQRLEKARQYLELARNLREGGTVAITPSEHAESASGRRAAAASRRPAAASAESGGDDDFSAQIAGLVKRSPVTWEQIAGLDQVKNDIRSAYAFAMAPAPRGVRLRATRSLLLYGPPGTGKTLLAAAASNGLKATFFSVVVGGLLSKYFGESSKLVSALFAEARRSAPAVIYFDEFDALAPSRSGGLDGPERRVLSTLLSELDGLDSKGAPGFLYVIGATNYPWDLDDAMLSRFGRLVHVPMPDPEARRGIFAIHFDRNGLRCDVPPGEMVAATEGYSGRDIERLCSESADLMLQRANPDLVSRVECDAGMHTVGELRVRPISRDEFATALQRIRPATEPESAARYTRWADSRSAQ